MTDTIDKLRLEFKIPTGGSSYLIVDYKGGDYVELTPYPYSELVTSVRVGLYQLLDALKTIGYCNNLLEST